MEEIMAPNTSNTPRRGIGQVINFPTKIQIKSVNFPTLMEEIMAPTIADTPRSGNEQVLEEEGPDPKTG